jgi:NAD(P)-dependent dehydrogenase (short-subunit alcohol dehydrogenase family)
MSTSTRVAIVTGANRGIGLEVCRQLAAHHYTVILTSRDAAKGRTAAEALGVAYHPLDVNHWDSVTRLRDWVVNEHGRADALINNAAVNLDDGQRFFEVEVETYRTTLETNLYGPLRLCHAFIPIMRQQKYGRIVNVSSSMGEWAELDGGTPAYSLSKTALNALTVMLAHQARGANILVNAVDPGWVRTDMGGPHASRSVAQGADTIVWAAMLPDNGPHGAFLRDRKRTAW